jgi:hypothetical protein
MLQEFRRKQLLAVALVADHMHRPDRMCCIGNRERQRTLSRDITPKKVDMPLASDVVADPDKQDNAEEG